MSVQAGDKVYVVWRTYEDRRGRTIRKLAALTRSYAEGQAEGTLIKESQESYEVEEWIVK